MAPRASARGAAFAGSLPARIALRRRRIIVWRIPVAAPLVNVIAYVEKTIRVRLVTSHRFGAGLPISCATLGITGQRFRRRISPRIQRAFLTAASRALPLRFGGQTKISARARPEPLAIPNRFMPRYADDWLLRMIEIPVAPEWRRRRTSRAKKTRVVGVGHLVCAQQEFVDPDAMHGPLAILTVRVLAAFASHEEPARRNGDERRSPAVRHLGMCVPCQFAFFHLNSQRQSPRRARTTASILFS